MELPTTTPLSLHRSRHVAPADPSHVDVASTASRYVDRFDSSAASAAARKAAAPTLVNEYYDLVTDFYLWGWGDSFHFAPRFATESFLDSLRRHEFHLALAGNFHAPGTRRVLDIGCGVGGPQRALARLTGCQVVGINNNPYQIAQAEQISARAGLQHLCSWVRCDFMHLPFPANDVDGAYAIEATCHAADKTQCYSEICRVLKPGLFFVGYEWVVTAAYDGNNPAHRAIKHSIEKGNALPDLETPEMVRAALERAGFDVLECRDLALEFAQSPAKNVPWYQPLEGGCSLGTFRSTAVGRLLTSTMVNTLEFLRLAPPGSSSTAAILEEAAVNLVEGGKLGIFSPMLFFKAQKRGT